MRVFHYQGGERTLTKFNPGCLELKPEIQSTQFSEDQMPLSKELMGSNGDLYSGLNYCQMSAPTLHTKRAIAV